MDTIIAAQARGWVLLSDDLHFRRIAKLVGVDGVWMQPALDLALEKHTLDEDAYHDAIVKLALMNHEFTRFGAGTLLRMAERAGWRLTAELERLLQKLGAPNVELRSAVIVVAQFFYGLLLSPAPRKPRGRIFAATLKAFEKHHVGLVPGIRDALRYLAEQAFPMKSHPHSRRRREWKEHLDAWLASFRRTSAGRETRRSREPDS